MARIGADFRRQDFIEATVKVIAAHGVASATTRRIATAANSPLASLHYVFNTKDDLLFAVYESLFSGPRQALASVPAGASAGETAAEMLRVVIAWFADHPDQATAQAELFFWAQRNRPDLANKIYTATIEATEQALDRASGRYIDNALVKSASRLLLHLGDGLLIAWAAHQDVERLKTEAEISCQALALFVNSR